MQILELIQFEILAEFNETSAIPRADRELGEHFVDASIQSGSDRSGGQFSHRGSINTKSKCCVSKSVDGECVLLALEVSELELNSVQNINNGDLANLIEVE